MWTAGSAYKISTSRHGSCFNCQAVNSTEAVMQYKTIQIICNTHNVCQLAELEVQAVTGGTSKIKKFKKLRQQHNRMFLNYV